MKVSELFHLERDQAVLDFVDVDTRKDVPIYVDPRAIRIQRGWWHDHCIALLQTFFHEVLINIKDANETRTRQLLGHLSEPNETHLGVSSGRPRGRGLGGTGAADIVESLTNSRAAKTGMLEDLEDTALLIDGIGPDITSDITTNVIRSALIDYTQRVCDQYDIPLTPNLYAGWIWDADDLEWHQVHANLPEAEGSLLLLVPKSIVRISLIFEPGKYYRRAIAPFHERREIAASSPLVYALKSGEKRVNRARLITKYGASKSAVVRHTEEVPQALKNYRETPGLASTPPLDHNTLAHKTGSPPPNFADLIDSIKSVAPGKAGATHFHRAAKDFLSAVFYPFLGNVQIEKPINEGRKRLDLIFDNVADIGFFSWIGKHRNASQIVVECKNYAADPGNPELDQLTGRFGVSRTEFGILHCRKVGNKALFLQRCRDSATAGRGFVFLLDDDDLLELIKGYDSTKGAYLFLRNQFDNLVG